MINANLWRLLPGLQIFTGLGILFFWLIFFTLGVPMENPPACYHDFEHAFPVPDTVLAIALIASAFNMRKGGRWGECISLASAGGLLFLGLIDISFSAQQGVFSGALYDAVLSAGLSGWCLALGSLIVALHATSDRIEPARQP